MEVTIYHNSKCATSRNVLAIISNFIKDPTVIDVLEVGYSRDTLKMLLSNTKMDAKSAMRIKNTPAEELGLTENGITNTKIFNAMLKHPLLVQRPFVTVETENSFHVALCRPSETVFGLLNVPSGTTFTKEDGVVVVAP